MRTSFVVVFYCVGLSLSSAESISGNPLTEEAHHPFNTQHHSQDTRGQYKYGYSNAHSAKEESRSIDGITRGSYSYIDANGVLQTVSYIADAEHGFKIIPNAVNSDPLQDHQRQPTSDNTANGDTSQVIENASKGQMSIGDVKPSSDDSRTGVDNNQIRFYGTNLNLLTRPAPIVGVYPTVLPFGYQNLLPSYHFVNYPIIFNPFPKYTQYHVQNGFGHYSYGYVNKLSSKDETKGADGITRGAYSYIDANGKLQTVSYTADAENGFRVMATNLPIAPVAPQ